MKPFYLMAAAILTCSAAGASADELVIMHTNDVHGNVRPARPRNRGGMLRTKVAIDSIRNAEEHTLLLDAGDDVQGYLYFTLFGGRVEYEMMNRLGYDMVTIGNHEFDNGMDSLRRNYDILKTPVLNANYDFSGTPLEGRIQPYAIRTFDDRKIAVIGIGPNPEGLIVDKNIQGVGYRHPYAIADNIAARLKADKKADYAIVLSHIGYGSNIAGEPCDSSFAKSTSHIDLIIGGHSHTEINPKVKGTKYIFTNKTGKKVLVAQTGVYGASLGKITVDLDNLGQVPQYELLPIDSRYDDRIDKSLDAWLKPYDEAIENVIRLPIVRSESELPHDSQELNNWVADMIADIAAGLTDKRIDAAVTNSGGIRQPLHKGDVSAGEIMTIVPFDNSIVVLEMDGKTLQQCLDDIVRTGGQAVSRQLSFAASNGKAVDVEIGGKPIDPEAVYHIATVDFVANGGDNLVSFRSGVVVAQSDRSMKQEFIDCLKQMTAQGKTVRADKTIRIRNLKQ